MKHVIQLAAPASALALCIAAWRLDGSGPTGREPTRSVEPSIATRKLDRAMERRLRRLEMQLEATQAKLLKNVSPRPLQAPPGDRGYAKKIESEDSLATSDDATAMGSTLESLSLVVESEPFDHRAAVDLERQLEGLIDGADLVDRVELDSVECYSTLCRFTATFEEEVSASDGVAAVMGTVDGPFYAFVNSEPPRAADIYLARAGHELPVPVHAQ